jgi:hypothetical protein
MAIRSRNEDHLLPYNEGTHLGVQMVEHLILVKGRGTGLRPEAFLEGMFTSRSWHSHGPSPR